MLREWSRKVQPLNNRIFCFKLPLRRFVFSLTFEQKKAPGLTATGRLREGLNPSRTEQGITL
jgi:hypothetical protein